MNSMGATKIILLVCLGHFCIDFMIGIWPVFKTIAGLDLATAGLVAALCVFTGESLQIFFGTLSDKGYGRILFTAGISVAATSLFFPFASTYTLFSLLYLGTCLGSSAFHPTAVSFLGSLSVARKSSIMGLFTASGMLGFGVSQISFTWAYFAFDGHTYILALLPLALAIGCYTLLPKGYKPSAAITKEKFNFALFRRFFKERTLLHLFMALLSNQIILFSFLFLLPDLLRSLQVSEWVAFGGGTLVMMIGATLSPPILGYLADKFSIRSVLVAVSILGFFALYGLLLPSVLSETVVIGLLFSIGILMGGVSALIWSFGAQGYPYNRGIISAFLMGVVWIFAEAGGIGVISALAGSFEEDGPRKALSLMGLMSFVGIAFAQRLPATIEVRAIS